MPGTAVLALAIVLQVATPESPQQVPDLRAADSVVAAWVTEEVVAGAVLLVARGDEVVHARAHGWAKSFDYGVGQYGGGAPRRLDTPTPMTVETVFDLASVTKVMATTFAVMMLVDDREVALDTPVYRYLPDFRGPEKDHITIRHLLTHRAGLVQWTPVYYHAHDASAAYRYIRDLPLGWRPGEGRHYSDLGFMLLGRVVEAVAGEPLGTFLHRRLYGPLDLKGTGYRPSATTSARTSPGPVGPFAATSHGNPFERRMVRDSTFGYRIQGDADAWDGWRRYTLQGEVNDGNAHHAFGGVAGHAGLFSTAHDLHRLLRLLLNGGVAGDRRFVGEDVVATFLSVGPDDQALGWQAPPYAPQGSFGHTGFTGTFVLGVPELDLAVVLLTNRQNVGVGPDTRYADLGALQHALVEALTGGAA